MYSAAGSTTYKDDILLIDRCTRDWTTAEVLAFFKDLNGKENKLYVHALSYLGLATPILLDLKNRLMAEESRYNSYIRLINQAINCLKSAGTEDKVDRERYNSIINRLANKLRLIVYARDWLGQIARVWANPHDNQHAEIESSLPRYQEWHDSFHQQFGRIVQMRQQISRDNQGLVRMIATERMKQSSTEFSTDYFADLFQDGMIGLMYGLSRFDYKRGLALSTYVTWWIRNSMQHAIADTSRTIRLPVHIRTKLAAAKVLQQKYYTEFGTTPDMDWVCKHTQANPQLIYVALLTSSIMSLDAPLSNTDDEVDGYSICADQNENGYDICLNRELKDKLLAALNLLTERERGIIAARFGYGANHYSDECSPLPSLSTLCGNVSRERVRQLEVIALKKLRKQLSRSDYL